MTNSERYNNHCTTRTERDGARLECDLAAQDEPGKTIDSPYEKLTAEVARRRQLQRHLEKQRELMRIVIDSVPNLIFVKDIEGRFTLANQAVASLYGTTVENLLGKLDSDFNPNPQECERFFRDDLAVIESGLSKIVKEEAVSNSKGDTRWFHTFKRPLQMPGTATNCILGVSSDITERKLLEAERERLLEIAIERADRDPLTGLWNHRAFHTRLGRQIEQVARYGGSFAVLLLDLDNFKFFNDAYGHTVGDSVLHQVCEAIQSCCSPKDTIARYGGDEFAVLVGDCNIEKINLLVERLEQEFASRGHRPPGYDTQIPISASCGWCIVPQEATNQRDVLETADARLRHTKSRNGVPQDVIDFLNQALQGIGEGFSMLNALVTAVDSKDRYTRRHSEDVLMFSLQMAREMGLSEFAQKATIVAAMLHDVGKIGVPDHILRKPGRLTPDEFDAIRQHAVMGAAIVGAVPGFENVLGAIRHHHERWDGNGYPDNLVAEECPLLGRILSVADAYSAMTTDRPYRRSLREKQAIAILKAGSGSQWDPRCVDVFLRTHGQPCSLKDLARRQAPLLASA